MAGSKDRILNNHQAYIIAAILHAEFAPTVAMMDPNFTGYAAVSQWASARQTRLYEDHWDAFPRLGGFRPPIGVRRAVDRKFRNYYRKLRSAHTNAVVDGQD
ncbi:unnamed protein product [Peniophora sp. CBMAI 1063]|nr:unnamed protein product [Peniophora sp. CBMAI 1063]